MNIITKLQNLISAYFGLYNNDILIVFYALMIINVILQFVKNLFGRKEKKCL